MLKGSNNSQLKHINIQDIYIPFYQIWQELFDSRTLDVYQYRVMNSLYALIELESVILKTIEGLYITDHNIDVCREELIYSKRDSVFVKYSKALLNRFSENTHWQWFNSIKKQ